MDNLYKKIKELGLLPDHYNKGTSFSIDDAKIFNPTSWCDWVLKDIISDRLFLEVRKGIRGEGQEAEINFKEEAYSKLTEEQRKGVENIFKNNVDNTIGMIIEIVFTY
jgi:hypothetical protein